MEKECIKTNISVYNNLAACILANARDNSISNVDQEHEKVVKYTGMIKIMHLFYALVNPILETLFRKFK